MRLPKWSSRVREPVPPSALLGRWRRVRSDEPDDDDGALMEFRPNGELYYIIEASDRGQIMCLTYRVEGDWIISDQPSTPREERTRFCFESPDVLVLEHEGARTWFRRD